MRKTNETLSAVMTTRELVERLKWHYNKLLGCEIPLDRQPANCPRAAFRTKAAILSVIKYASKSVVTTHLRRKVKIGRIVHSDVLYTSTPSTVMKLSSIASSSACFDTPSLFKVQIAPLSPCPLEQTIQKYVARAVNVLKKYSTSSSGRVWNRHQRLFMVYTLSEELASDVFLPNSLL